MNVVCQSKNCNNKWSNIVLLEWKSTTFSLFLCENHANNLEYELLPKWLKTCEKLRKNNKIKKERFIMKTWIKTNLSKITLALALTGAISGVTGLIIGSITHHKTNNLQYFLDYDGKVHWGDLYNDMVRKKMIFIKYIYIFQLILHLKVM
ncbi:hypothetical protein [Spiroplasma endosymbiont of Villa modesta]|uniref:hypothetical protein n=1 Tax=Spiroplasma endosymbiont of Villa modesta TaxID=3066293 RepID=UPI00313E04B3